jgi:O-acetyl-ADP-ribose deacetylase (regulator of RNase III)
MSISILPKKGNLLDVTSGHIVHGCNAKAVMGSGVALAVKKKYPIAFESYQMQSVITGLKLGYAYPVQIDNKLCIWNAITQEEYGQPTRNCSYDAIQSCFEQINKHLAADVSGIVKEVHIPLIGAGLGGGNWNIISTIIEETMDFDVTLWILQ